MEEKKQEVEIILQSEIEKLNKYKTRLISHCDSCPEVIRVRNKASWLKESLTGKPTYEKVNSLTVLPECENLLCIVNDTIKAYEHHKALLQDGKVSVQKHAGIPAIIADVNIENLQDLLDDISHRNKSSIENLDKMINNFEHAHSTTHAVPKFDTGIILAIIILVIVFLLMFFLYESIANLLKNSFS